jgi:hypothetical protein
MYLPPSDQLVPRLNEFYAAIARASADEGKKRAIMMELEQLPYYLRGACAALYQLESARIDAGKAFALIRQRFPETPMYMLTGDQCHELSFSVDFCLACIRRVPDSLICHLKRLPINLDLPLSFHDLIKGLEAKRKKYRLDQTIQDLVMAYWHSVARRVKDYRDLANHYTIVSSECLLFVSGDGSVGLRMLLPDNPNEKSPTKLTYDPGIQAMSYLRTSLIETIRFVNATLSRLLQITPQNSTDAPQMIAPIFRGRGGPIQLGGEHPPTGEPVPFPYDISAIVAEAGNAK